MPLAEGGARVPKRRRLDDPQSQTQTRSYLSLICSNNLPSSPQGQYDECTTIYKGGAYAKGPCPADGCDNEIGGGDIIEALEDAPSECCYGMVREKLTTTNQNTSRSLTGLA
jgi:hypothetical protein